MKLLNQQLMTGKRKESGDSGSTYDDHSTYGSCGNYD